jgi:hypothetical protein
VKTIKKLECPACRISLLVDTPESCHIFTQFKEYDDQKMRLKYVTKELICFVAHIHDMVIFYLKRFGHISNIVQKLRMVVIERTDFNWFQCNTHSSEIRTNLLKTSIHLILYKYLDDVQREFQETNRKKNI